MLKQVSMLAVGMALMVGVSHQGLAIGTGIPVCGQGEITTQYVDQAKSYDGSEWSKVEADLEESVFKALAGGYSASNLEKALKQLSSSEGVAKKNQGTEDVMGDSFKGSKCAKNTSEVVSTLNSSIAYSPKTSDRVGLSSTDVENRESTRLSSIEKAGTTGLSKSWLVQTEAATIANQISNTKKALDNANSQMAVMALIMVLQETTRKDLNTRVSLMGDDLTNVGLMALEENM